MRQITYTKQGDYFYPDVTLPKQPETELGIWGIRYKNYLMSHKKVTYYNLLTSGKLTEHLVEIDKQCEDLFSQLINQLSKEEGITEQLKADSMLEWVGKMNNIKMRAKEIVIGQLY